MISLVSIYIFVFVNPALVDGMEKKGQRGDASLGYRRSVIIEDELDRIVELFEQTKQNIPSVSLSLKQKQSLHRNNRIFLDQLVREEGGSSTALRLASLVVSQRNEEGFSLPRKIVSSSELSSGIKWSDTDYVSEHRKRYLSERKELIKREMDFVEEQLEASSQLEAQVTNGEYSKTFADEMIGLDSKDDKEYDDQIFFKRHSDQKKRIIDRLDFLKKKWRNIEAHLGVSSGYRFAKLQWSIAGNPQGTNPNILSELTWPELHILGLNTDGQVVWGNFFRCMGSFHYGWIVDGENQDSDYLFSDKGGEFSRSNNSTDDDNVWDATLGLGVQFRLSEEPVEALITDNLWMAILGGYSYHQQNLRVTNGYQTSPPRGSFSGLNSTYQTEWDGPWAGIELFGSKGKVDGFFRFEYHLADFLAEANWNLRSDFAHPVSYSHHSDGRGLVFAAGGKFPLNDWWHFNVNMDIQRWKANAGIDRTFFANGAIVETKLNEVNWESYALMFGATYYFSN